MSAGAPSASDAIGLSRANFVRAIRLPRSGTASGVIAEHWPSRAPLRLDQLSTAGSGMNARTSCAQRQATAILAAHASAASREGTSMIVSPPMYALFLGPSL